MKSTKPQLGLYSIPLITRKKALIAKAIAAKVIAGKVIAAKAIAAKAATSKTVIAKKAATFVAKQAVKKIDNRRKNSSNI